MRTSQVSNPMSEHDIQEDVVLSDELTVDKSRSDIVPALLFIAVSTVIFTLVIWMYVSYPARGNTTALIILFMLSLFGVFGLSLAHQTCPLPYLFTLDCWKTVFGAVQDN